MSEVHSQEWYKQRALNIQQNVQKANVYAIQGDIQAKLEERNITLTFYYRTGKYHLSTSGSMVFFTEGREHQVIMKYVNMEVEKAIAKADEANKNKPVIIKEIFDKGTQACINHVLKRAETIGTIKGADHASARLLKQLAQEFEQYL